MSHDDDLDEPLSTRRALERADHGKTERKEVKQKKELQRLKLDLLKQNLQRNDERKGPADDMSTKTREEEAKEAVDEVDTVPSMDRVIRSSQRQEAERKQAPYEQSPKKVG